MVQNFSNENKEVVISSIFDRLKGVQQQLKAPKNQRNNYGGYNYRSCEDILEAVKPLLGTNSLSLLINDEIVLIGDRYYIKATATIFDDKGNYVSNSGYAREELTRKGMDSAQITGAASSYARKYALNGLFAIDDTKDADALNNGEEPKKRTTATSQQTTATSKATEKTTAKQALAELAKVKSVEELKLAFTRLPRELRTDDSIIDFCKKHSEKLTQKVA